MTTAEQMRKDATDSLRFADEDGWSDDDLSRLTAQHVLALLDMRAELLAACKLMLPYLPTRQDMLNYAATNEGNAGGYSVAAEAIRAAIARAEGRA
jgi:hypothetical protein